MPGWDFYYRHFLCCVVFCCDVTQLHVHALHEKHLVTQLCFLFRTVYAPFGSLQMCQHRTGNNTASETTQSFEEKVLQGFHNSKGLNTKTTAGPFCLVWYGLICLILPLFHLPVCHFQPKSTQTAVPWFFYTEELMLQPLFLSPILGRVVDFEAPGSSGASSSHRW